MTPEDNVRLWLAHLTGEFTNRNEEESLATMVEDASVCHVPTDSGGVGKTVLRRYYRDEFIPSIPEDWNLTLTNRVATDNCIAEEARLRFHHTKQMDWFLPGIPATGNHRNRYRGFHRLPRRADGGRAHLLGSGLSAAANRYVAPVRALRRQASAAVI
jgi:hypothetical protein